MNKQLIALGLALSMAFGSSGLQAQPKTFTWSASADALSMDPYSTNNSFTTSFINNIYEGLVRFNERDEITSCEAPRYISNTEMLPWQAHLSQYRRHHGMLVPFVGEASWVVDGQRQPYARFFVTALEYEPHQAF